ncbi:MAG: toxin-antitoxin system YwqK family antitoxin [Fusobacterium sp.]
MKKLLITLLLGFTLIGCSNLENKKENVFVPESILPKDVRAVSIYKKAYDKGNKIAYVKGETEPFTGVFTLKYIDHILHFEQYRDGKLDGDVAWFNNEGVLGMRHKYKEGKLNGEQYTYYDNGNIRSIITYVDGKLNGKIEWYTREGILFDSREIINGTGGYILYWENGKVQEEGNYKNGKKIGSWKKYNNTGEIIKEVVYSSNGYISKVRWYR